MTDRPAPRRPFPARSIWRSNAAANCMICIEEIPRFAATIDEIEEEKEQAGLRFTAVIRRAKELAGQKGVSLETHLLAGHPVPSIVEFLRAGTFDLLVVGFMGIRLFTTG
jgi:nucleotide-binding universal stress UspA family protein